MRIKKFQLLEIIACCLLLTWWLLRGGCTRSHAEHGRETPQRQWYFVLRRGRVGRCQVYKMQQLIKLIFSFTSCPDGQRSSIRWLNSGWSSPAVPQAQSQADGKQKTGQSPPVRVVQTPRSARHNAGWSSPVARQAHNLKAAGSNPAPATNRTKQTKSPTRGFFAFITSHQNNQNVTGRHTAPKRQSPKPKAIKTRRSIGSQQSADTKVKGSGVKDVVSNPIDPEIVFGSHA